MGGERRYFVDLIATSSSSLSLLVDCSFCVGARASCGRIVRWTCFTASGEVGESRDLGIGSRLFRSRHPNCLGTRWCRNVESNERSE